MHQCFGVVCLLKTLAVLTFIEVKFYYFWHPTDFSLQLSIITSSIGNLVMFLHQMVFVRLSWKKSPCVIADLVSVLRTVCSLAWNVGFYKYILPLIRKPRLCINGLVKIPHINQDGQSNILAVLAIWYLFHSVCPSSLCVCVHACACVNVRMRD